MSKDISDRIKDGLSAQFGLQVFNAQSQLSSFNNTVEPVRLVQLNKSRHKRMLGVERPLEIRAAHKSTLVYQTVLNLRTFPSADTSHVLIKQESAKAKNTVSEVSIAENRGGATAPRSLTFLFNHNMKQLVAARASSAIASIENRENVEPENTSRDRTKLSDRYRH